MSDLQYRPWSVTYSIDPDQMLWTTAEWVTNSVDPDQML